MQIRPCSDSNKITAENEWEKIRDLRFLQTKTCKFLYNIYKLSLQVKVERGNALLFMPTILDPGKLAASEIIDALFKLATGGNSILILLLHYLMVVCKLQPGR